MWYLHEAPLEQLPQRETEQRGAHGVADALGHRGHAVDVDPGHELGRQDPARRDDAAAFDSADDPRAAHRLREPRRVRFQQFRKPLGAGGLAEVVALEGELLLGDGGGGLDEEAAGEGS